MDPITHRQKLGDVIRFHREQRSKTLRDVSRRTGAPITDCEAWERGTLVPDSDAWQRIRQGIHRGLNAYGELYQRARKEHDDAIALVTRSITMHGQNGHRGAAPASTVATNLGDKIGRALQPKVGALMADGTPWPGPVGAAPIAPLEVPIARVDTLAATQVPTGLEQPPAPAKARAMPDRPDGSFASSEVEKRKAFARGMLLQRPNARASGRDSVVEAVRQRFGIGLTPATIEQIREEIAREREGRPAGVELPPPTITPKAAAPVATGEINEADIGAAVDLLLGAIPNLQAFSITVDEHGEASVDYEIREVKITTRGGSLKVRR